MLLVDSSVWIQSLRAAPFPAFDELLSRRAAEFALTEPVLMEVLAGARRPDQVELTLTALPLRAVRPDLDYLNAAALYRRARAAGVTIRSLEDCLIAAIALRHSDVVVHRDSDFEEISELTGLDTIDLR